MALDPFLQQIAPPGPGSPGLPSDVPTGESLLYYWYPIRPLDLVRQHLRVALLNLEAKRYWLDRRWNYYLGRHEERVLSEKLRDLLKSTSMSQVLASMFTNYCSLVTEQPLSRLRVTGWKGDQEEVADAEELWDSNDLDVDAEEVHRAAITAGEAYVIVWPRRDPETGEPVLGDDGDPLMDVVLQDARNMHVQYGSRRRRDRQWACKIWLDEDVASGTMHWRVVMYYADEVIRLVSRSEAKPMSITPRDPLEFILDEQDPGGPHQMGAVPVVRFARSWDGRSKLDDVIPIQDRVNKLTGDKIIAAEYGAFPQRWALTNDDPPPGALRAGPGALWVLSPASTSPDANEDSPTTVGQFPSTDLANYDTAIQQEVSALFSVAMLPRHLLINPGVAPSGEAIKADEGPMVANVRGYRDLFGSSWEDVMELAGIEVEPVWQDVEVHNELTAAQTFRELATAGLPLRLAAEIALDLDEEALDLLSSLPVPPQPGAGVPGQSAAPAQGDGGEPAPAPAQPTIPANATTPSEPRTPPPPQRRGPSVGSVRSSQ